MHDWFASLTAKYHSGLHRRVTKVTQVTSAAMARDSVVLDVLTTVTTDLECDVTSVTALEPGTFPPVTSVTDIDFPALQEMGGVELAKRLDECRVVTHVTPVTPVEGELSERAAIVEFDARVPREWAEGYARLCAMTRPAAIAERDWLALQDTAGRVLDRWGLQLSAFGWTVEELFGAHGLAPWARLDRVGLVRFATRFDILDVAADTVTIGNAQGARNTIRRRYDDRDQGWTLFWDLPPEEDEP